MGKKILFVNQEMSPYVPETTLSVMGRDVPATMQEAGFEIRTFMPRWGIINERRGQLHEVIRLSGVNLIIDDIDHPLIIKVASIPQTRLQVYFIDNDEYFMKRKMALDESGKEYADNGERAIFFARGVLETVKKLRWNPDVIHCQGWMAALIPLYIKHAYQNEPAFATTKVVTSLFKDRLNDYKDAKFKACAEYKDANADVLKAYQEEFDYDELMKLAIDFSDAVVEGEQDANPAIMDYAEKSGKPIVRYSDEGLQEAYKTLYDEI